VKQHGEQDGLIVSGGGRGREEKYAVGPVLSFSIALVFTTLSVRNDLMLKL
jgi:hypothetical protein